MPTGTIVEPRHLEAAGRHAVVLARLEHLITTNGGTWIGTTQDIVDEFAGTISIDEVRHSIRVLERDDLLTVTRFHGLRAFQLGAHGDSHVER